MRAPFQFLSRFAAVVLSIMAFTLPVFAAVPDDIDPYDMSLAENIATPAIPQKQKEHIKGNLEHLKSKIARSGFNVSSTRQGEVLMVTIACDRLFEANIDTLSIRGHQLLEKLPLPSSSDGSYKILIAAHSDDTGEIEYSDNITAARANAVDDAITGHINSHNIMTVPYGMGRDEPIESNDSVRKRARNRRIELYYVPIPTKSSKK